MMTSMGMKLFGNSLIQSLSINILKCGRIPKHVAFLMDGNRRHAKNNNIPLCDAHKIGYRKYDEVIDWCMSLGIQEASIFFVSINNFCKRSKEEIDYLVIETKTAFERMIENADEYAKKGIQVRVIGNWEHLPKELHDVITRVMMLTKDNRGFRFSIAIAYSGTDEIAQATANIVSGLQDGSLSADDVTPALLDAAMLTGDSLPLDILIRTSGERIEIKKKSGIPMTKQAEAFLRELYEKREAKMVQLNGTN